ncbi:hypothetical protein HYV87_02080 [Candidatus Woesearchaeota archaeon]|nr:hypothetical protein [Candidatus Woesearchaeota archaeon]
MKKKYHYLSVFSPQEAWGKEQISYYESLLRADVGLDRLKSAREKLKFYHRFDPGIPHDRIVAQVVTVSSIYDPSWQSYKRGKLLAAGKNPFKVDEGLEQKLEIDFGELAKKVSLGVEPQEMPYLGFQFDNDHFGKGRLTLLTIEFLPCRYEEPILFSVLEYVSIDGERIQQNRKNVCPTFDHDTHIFKGYLSKADN